MEEIAEVIENKGDRALVQITRHSACSKCTQKCNLANSYETDEIRVEVNNQIGARQGQIVKLEMDEQNVVFASLIVYLFPLLSLIAGYFIGIWFAFKMGYQASKGFGVIGSLLFLVISFLLIRLIDSRLGHKKNFHPRITEILGP